MRIDIPPQVIPDDAKPEGSINPWPLALLLGAWLWLGIWLVERVFTR